MGKRVKVKGGKGKGERRQTAGGRQLPSTERSPVFVVFLIHWVWFFRRDLEDDDDYAHQSFLPGGFTTFGLQFHSISAIGAAGAAANAAGAAVSGCVTD